MVEELFVQGNEACAKGAIKAGCRFFAGYPITPSTEVAENLAKDLPTVGGSFVQMEDEIASAGAIIGGSWGGSKSMTATSGPGFSLMQENIGYAFITETPIVIVNVQRGSPSTGQPTMAAQADMMQARWGSHGDYEPIALAPSSVQEFFDFTIKAFNLAEEYRTPVFVMADEVIGHMREKIVIDDDIEIVPRTMPNKEENYLPFKNVENGTNPMPSFGEGFNIHVTGLTHDERGYPDTNSPETHTELVQRLCDKILNNKDKICSVVSEGCEDADIVVVSYGAPVRSVITAVKKAQEEGKKVGYIKIDTPWPFPDEQIAELVGDASDVIVVEMNLGQMYYEVDRVLDSKVNTHLIGIIGGLLPTPDEILSKIEEIGGN
ncbi:MAG: 2-oxoacid:acceptor oxidoreductase subunit alpha [Methanobrevibacter woesei]|uniref:2-oxoacid:acceptor oxidoreductase subunit alpha n=1 Tax=Methanobrevibacter woesei TaxID=190976 RepID=UPI001F8AF6ED|nr:2-oxoacid:acceptor oxidoreductase subunit alpha [Methanobrevibacter woesei]MCC9260832.1 2-oxoacid:acceptor oxidoreductase subunit alpha [Methanobrevibacter woesei]